MKTPPGSKSGQASTHIYTEREREKRTVMEGKNENYDYDSFFFFFALELIFFFFIKSNKSVVCFFFVVVVGGRGVEILGNNSLFCCYRSFGSL